MKTDAFVFSVFLLISIILGCGSDSHNRPTKMEAFYLKTRDSLSIYTTFWRSSKKIPQPAVILIHQGGSDHHEWDLFAKDLVKHQYNILSYDIRGHGKSTPVNDIYALFDDPRLAPEDLRTVIQFLKEQPEVDHRRIAIVGASIGGNLACVGIAKWGIKTAVSISAKTAAVYHLANADSLALGSIFFIASQNDQDGQRAEWADELYRLSKEPRKLDIVDHSAAHGVKIFNDAPEEPGKIVEWLLKHL